MRRGLWFTLTECDRQRRLLLEYDRSSQTGFCILQSSYGETNALSYEANWYINTTIVVYRYSVHGAFFTIDGVGFIVNVHDDLSTAIVVNGDNIWICFIPNNFSVESFHQRTDRNHGSPVAVYIRSSIAGNNVVVDNIIGRTNGHNNAAVSERIFLTYRIVESSCISAIIGAILDDNTDLSSGFFGGVDGQAALTIAYSTAGFDSNLSIFVALIIYESFESTIDLCTIAVFINNSYVNFVVFVDRTFFRIKSERKCIVRIYNGQLAFNILFVSSIPSHNSYNGAKQRIVACNVLSGCKYHFTGLRGHMVNQSFTSSSDGDTRCPNLQAVFVNILRFSSYILAESDFIAQCNCSLRAAVFSSQSNFQILNFTKFSNVEAYSSIIFAEQRYANGVLTRYENVCNIIDGTIVLQSVNTLSLIPSESDIGRFDLGFFWPFKNIHVLSMFLNGNSISIACWFVGNSFCASYSITFFIKDFKLNSIGEQSVIPIFGEIATS